MSGPKLFVNSSVPSAFITAKTRAGVAVVGERIWSSRVLAGMVDPPRAGLAGQGSFLAGRLQATVWTLVAPTGARAGPVSIVAVIVAILVLLAGLRVRGDAPRWRDAQVLLVVAAVVAVAGVVVSPDAISGIIVVGAMLQLGVDDAAVRTLSFVAVLLASINVFGGFAVTRRMLGMFRKADQ